MAELKPCPFCGSVNELHVGIKSGKVIWNMLDTRKLTYRKPPVHHIRRKKREGD